jgi:uncharacterized protein YlxW (UPF0749 family)
MAGGHRGRDCQGKYGFFSADSPPEPGMEAPSRKDPVEKLQEEARQVQKDLNHLTEEINELLEKIKQIPIGRPPPKKKNLNERT